MPFRSFALACGLVLLPCATALAQAPDPQQQPPPQAAPPADTPEVLQPAGEADTISPQEPDSDRGDADNAGPVRRPYQGIFGPEADRGVYRQVSNLMVTASAGWDDNGIGNVGGGMDPRLTRSGSYGDVDTAVDYSRRGRLGSFSANGSTTLGRYQVLSGTVVNAGGGLGATLSGRRTRLNVSQTANYSPFYNIGLFAALPRAPGTDVDVVTTNRSLDVGDLESVSSGSHVELGHTLSPRVEAAMFYEYSQVRFLTHKEYDISDQRIGARLIRRMTRYASLHLEYGFRTGKLGAIGTGTADEARTRHTHDVIAGVEYARTFTFWCRTSVGFTTGSSVLVAPQRQQQSLSSDERQRFIATGQAWLTQALGRTWQARAEYERGVNFVSGFPDPVLSSTITSALQGYLGRRVDVGVSASYASGSVGYQGPSNDFKTARATGDLRIALNRHWAILASGLYYHHDFGNDVGLPVRVASVFDRTGVRVGLTTWLPLQRGKD